MFMYFLIKLIDILENMIELYVYHYFLLIINMTECLIELDTLLYQKDISNSDVYSHKDMKIKIKSGDDLLLEKTLTMSNDVILIKFAFNKKI